MACSSKNRINVGSEAINEETIKKEAFPYLFSKGTPLLDFVVQGISNAFRRSYFNI